MTNMDDEEMEEVQNDEETEEEEGIEEEQEEIEQEEEEPAVIEEEKVYLPGDPMPEDQELTFDKSAYHMYHVAQTGAPCLSFDIVPDELGNCRTEFPMTCYMVCGTGDTATSSNSLIAMKMSNLTKTEADASDSEESFIDDEEDKQPRLQTASLKHVGGVNRTRQCTIGTKKFVSTWSDTGKVHIWDVSAALNQLDQPGVQDHLKLDDKPVFSFAGHQDEGFAMDWSGTTPGRLVTGSCNRNIHLWQLREGGEWAVDQRPMNAHESSIEDLQWSPNEPNVFASCSADQTVRIWDSRGVGAKACMITCKAHDADVNVISWNRNDPFIVSGGDDGVIKIWDLRKIQQGSPVAVFKHHTKPITSVEWHHTDNTVLAASCDDQVTIWDLAVERDDADTTQQSADPSQPPQMQQLPPQLLFIHMGQQNIKELHWHNQLPGVLVSTSESGFNVFKTISV